MKKALLTLFAALLCATSATAEVIDGIGYNLYKANGNYAKVTRDYSVSYIGDIVIPPTVSYKGETYTVIGIESHAMQDISMVTSLSIPATMTDIETNNNFIWKNSLESITVADGNPKYDSREGCNAIIETSENKLILGCANTVIPKGVTVIREGAFSYSGLTTAVIPKSVTAISEKTFLQCSQLTTVTILGELSEGIDEDAFSGCNALTDIYLYTETPPSLDSDAFGEDGIDGITLHVPAAAIETYKENNSWSRNCESIVALPAADTTKGDANGDGKVDVLDVTTTISYILDPQTAPFNKEAADMDSDNDIDIDDVKAIVDIILK